LQRCAEEAAKKKADEDYRKAVEENKDAWLRHHEREKEEARALGMAQAREAMEAQEKARLNAEEKKREEQRREQHERERMRAFDLNSRYWHSTGYPGAREKKHEKKEKRDEKEKRDKKDKKEKINEPSSSSSGKRFKS